MAPRKTMAPAQTRRSSRIKANAEKAAKVTQSNKEDEVTVATTPVARKRTAGVKKGGNAMAKTRTRGKGAKKTTKKASRVGRLKKASIEPEAALRPQARGLATTPSELSEDEEQRGSIASQAARRPPNNVIEKAKAMARIPISNTEPDAIGFRVVERAVGSAIRVERVDDGEPDVNIEPIHQRFERSDLAEVGALEIDGAHTPTLSNPVHPIWHYRRFTFHGPHHEQQNIEAYAGMLPALRLASYWITEPQFQTFWLPLWFPQNEDEDEYIVSQPAPDYAKAMAPRTAERFREVADTFTDTGLEWRFGLQEHEQGFAVTEAPENIEDLMKVVNSTRAGIPGSITRLHDDFREVAQHTTSARLRFFFFFAVRLVRELVWHVFCYQWRLRHQNGPEPPDRSTVLYQLDLSNTSNLDIAWEIFMFGGPIYRINTAPLPIAPDGIAVEAVELKPVVLGNDDDDDNSEDDPSKDVYAPIPMSWINDLFSAQLWNDEKRKEERIPGLRIIPGVRAREPAIGAEGSQ